MARRDDEDYYEPRGRPEPYVALNPPRKHSGFHTIVTLGIIFLVFVGGIYAFYYFSSSAGQRTATSVWGTVTKPVYDLYNYIVQQTTSAGTAFYTADTNATAEKYGVDFVKFESVSSKKIPGGSMASFRYVVSLGENVQNTPLTLQCMVDPQDVVYGDIKKTPEGVIQLSSENPAIANNLRCSFKTKAGNEDRTVTVKGTMSATIPTQRASLKVYLLAKSEYEALKGQDFFKVNNKPDKLPIKAVYNGEPVEIGIGVSGGENEQYNQPVVVGQDYNPMVGIGLTNRWNGKVTKINSLTLFLPEGISIDTGKSPKNDLCPFGEGAPSSTNPKIIVYTADTSLLGNVLPFGSGETDSYRKFECYLNINDDLVAGKKAGLQTSYHVDIGYDYVFAEKSDVITVAKSQTAENTTQTTETNPSPEGGVPT